MVDTATRPRGAKPRHENRQGACAPFGHTSLRTETTRAMNSWWAQQSVAIVKRHENVRAKVTPLRDTALLVSSSFFCGVCWPSTLSSHACRMHVESEAASASPP